ncbi:Glutaredoxin [Quillaja saponaria]|uniref:Glutaredoxin n=1 Tax=Quillaja saponaria TaxID=32244 RepID=A0AAD7LTA3_QUISA|nr:Glutaredoxin [Quillaja saponaria]
MLPPQWLRSLRRARSTPTPRSLSFSCSSFKDIQNLCQEEPESEPATPRSPSIFCRVQISTSIFRSWAPHSSSSLPLVILPDNDQGIVVYYTSLRVVRRTFEDCKVVKSILRGFRVSIDERDVSMDELYLEELHGILGNKNVTLPRVFIGGVYAGGVEEIKQLYESGELKKLIRALPVKDLNVCDFCGGLKFVVCEECNGSHKVYMEKSGFKTCTACNVNGLIRCPSCSLVLRRTPNNNIDK